MKTNRFTMVVLIAGMFAATTLQAQTMNKNYQEVYVERVLPVSADQAWKALGEDYGRVANFLPDLWTSDYEPGSLKGEPGAERRCAFDEKGKRWMHEKVADFDPVNRRLTNTIVETSMPLDAQNTRIFYEVKDNKDGTCTASYKFQYRTKPAWMGGMVKGMFRKQLKNALIGLEHHLVTGEVVNKAKGNFKKIRKQYS